MTITRQTFSDARLKVERGSRHIQEYANTLVAFLNTDFCKLSVEQDIQTGHYFIKADASTPYPRDFPTIIGDAVHNLRTALDYIIVDITGLKPTWISLPTGRQRADIEASPRYGAIRRKLPHLADFILNEIQPYEGGRYKIWELAELDNIDKHRLLIPMVTIASLHRVDVEDEAGNRIYSGFASVLQGRVQDIATGVNKPKIKHKGYAGIDVRFGESTPLLGKPVFETIGEFPEIVSKAIDAFELFCLGTIADPNTVER